jgi:hypothetical protein
MAENLDYSPSKPRALSLKQLTQKKNVKKVVGALSAIILTNIIKYLLSINLISKWFFDIFGLPPSTYFYNNLRHIVIGVLIIGYGVVFYFLYKRFVAPMASPRRIFIGTLLMLGMASIFMLNVYSLPLQPDAKVLIPTKEWSDKIAASQAPNGGIREKAIEQSYPTQVWTTAQALTGILADQRDLDEKKVKTIKVAFDYIEKARHPHSDDKNQPDEGWGLFDISKKSTTEVAGWVAIANIASVESKTKIWDDAEFSAVLTRIQRDLNFIRERQEENGGWRPIIDKGTGFTRTYSTVIALWSLIEARRSKVVYERIGNTYDTNISKGIDWLLKNYTKVIIDGKEQVLGWVPNPNRRGQRERFDGLTAQVLYVLSRVENQPGFEYLINDGTYLDAKRNFVEDQDLATRFVCANDRIHDYDLAFIGEDLDFVLEGSTLLWFPWSYAELTNLSYDTTLTPQERSAAASLRKGILNSKVDDINKFVQEEFMYVLAENLYCLSVSDDQSRSGKK